MGASFLPVVLIVNCFLLVDAGKLFYYNDRLPAKTIEVEKAPESRTDDDTSPALDLEVNYPGLEKLPLNPFMPLFWGMGHKMSGYFYGSPNQQAVNDRFTTQHHHHGQLHKHPHHHKHCHCHKHQKHSHHQHQGLQHEGSLSHHHRHHHATTTTTTSTTTSPPVTEMENVPANAKLSQLQAVIKKLEYKLQELQQRVSNVRDPTEANVEDAARWDISQEKTDPITPKLTPPDQGKSDTVRFEKPTVELQAEHRQDDAGGKDQAGRAIVFNEEEATDANDNNRLDIRFLLE
ncbi:uncharacterized protein LOC131293656 [Anopheles ziemanni]|uniref:uncharacterized protein LOC131265701 n=1 Tax=Anopheles coustani TaxID=139045 RepID=UPI002658D157|nr:uncharacterized protein LOC131265701 [Anopheles coustani]XP_058123984.1 uncharacterized protein LOC131265701 [Anopheles coustani]XP_058123985.1 uncharacterized protein LOC131265701 [Anopheles coustani]XP_058177718.1 uncharacterized protein LOC131293656 [Anopheles ziemanni]